MVWKYIRLTLVYRAWKADEVQAKMRRNPIGERFSNVIFAKHSFAWRFHKPCGLQLCIHRVICLATVTSKNLNTILTLSYICCSQVTCIYKQVGLVSVGWNREARNTLTRWQSRMSHVGHVPCTIYGNVVYLFCKSTLIREIRKNYVLQKFVHIR